MPAINPAEFELQRKQLEALRQQVSKAREVQPPSPQTHPVHSFP
jgi:hypothetical protein